MLDVYLIPFGAFRLQNTVWYFLVTWAGSTFENQIGSIHFFIIAITIIKRTIKALTPCITRVVAKYLVYMRSYFRNAAKLSDYC